MSNDFFFVGYRGGLLIDTYIIGLLINLTTVLRSILLTFLLMLPNIFPIIFRKQLF